VRKEKEKKKNREKGEKQPNKNKLDIGKLKKTKPHIFCWKEG
jgi:hypothetical protein